MKKKMILALSFVLGSALISTMACFAGDGNDQRSGQTGPIGTTMAAAGKKPQPYEELRRQQENTYLVCCHVYGGCDGMFQGATDIYCKFQAVLKGYALMWEDDYESPFTSSESHSSL